MLPVFSNKWGLQAPMIRPADAEWEIGGKGRILLVLLCVLHLICTDSPNLIQGHILVTVSLRIAQIRSVSLRLNQSPESFSLTQIHSDSFGLSQSHSNQFVFARISSISSRLTQSHSYSLSRVQPLPCSHMHINSDSRVIMQVHSGQRRPNVSHSDPLILIQVHPT